ncbi:hypothetical protein Agub_g15837 [Astrephomene gubernaculifera]|uniref:LOV domain-containing protein n=1 Tax=Astrephomene gubernaculifera TaxID=47775 RepID=A0AAD3HU78_9CHLO|nr:hypothetical protein Agub_g15837 [Astrephomene gubernaculifera]
MGSGSSKNRAKREKKAPIAAPAVVSPSAGTKQVGSLPPAVSTPKAASPAPPASTSNDSLTVSEPEYKGADLPINEDERLGFLCKLGVLDTAPEKRFDDITRLCCLVFKTPIALVSLVDKDRQWFKSVQGLTVNQTDRKSSFCAWTLLPEFPEVLVVENALEDIRFRSNPLVLGPPHIRFYAGCPLVAANGLRLGSLCIIDSRPRPGFDAESCNMLANMAEMVVREVEKDVALEAHRRQSERLTRENVQLIRALDCFSEGIMLLNMSLPSWPILFANEAWERATGLNKERLAGGAFWGAFTTPDDAPDSSRLKLASVIEGQQSFNLAVCYPPTSTSASFSTSSASSTPAASGSGVGAAGGSGRRHITLQFRCAHNSTVDAYMPLVGIPSILSPSPEAGGPLYYFVTLSAAPRASQDIGPGSKRASPFSIVNTKIDPFEDVKLGPLLGKGAYGRVYRGVWNGAQVAVKVLETVQPDSDEGGASGLGFSTNCTTSSGGCTAFSGGGGTQQGHQQLQGGEVLEAVLGSQISHPNIVQTYKHCTRPMGQATDADNEGRTLLETWMVLEFCNKGGLSDAIERGWFRKRHSLFEVDFRALVATAREVAAAMTYLHDKNILHGDLTGNNVLLTASDRDERHFVAKVADFGLSRVLAGEAVTTRSYGTITHMCPELLIDGLLSKAADVYSFGVVVWEMFSGQRPFSGLTHGQILHAITTGKQLPIGSSCPQLLRSFLLRCLAPNPADRPSFPHILQLLEELEQELC